MYLWTLKLTQCIFWTLSGTTFPRVLVWHQCVPYSLQLPFRYVTKDNQINIFYSKYDTLIINGHGTVKLVEFWFIQFFCFSRVRFILDFTSSINYKKGHLYNHITESKTICPMIDELVKKKNAPTLPHFTLYGSLKC